MLHVYALTHACVNVSQDFAQAAHPNPVKQESSVAGASAHKRPHPDSNSQDTVTNAWSTSHCECVIVTLLHLVQVKQEAAANDQESGISLHL